MMSKRSSDRMNGWRICLDAVRAPCSSCSARWPSSSGGVEVAVDELDRLEDAAGGFALPDLAEPAAAEPLDEPVAGDRLSSVVE